MRNRLITYFKKVTQLTPQEERVILDSMHIRAYRKGEFLVHEGEPKSDTFFVLDGVVREFKTVNGDEVTTNFYSEEQWIISAAGLSESPVSQVGLICAEDVSIVIGNEKKAQELFEKFPRFETVSRQIVEAAFVEHQTFMASYISAKPEQRYLKLLKTRPDLLQRVPQYDIASFIGVKPESLSRIRKKLTM